MTNSRDQSRSASRHRRSSQKTHQLHLQHARRHRRQPAVVPELAESLEHPDRLPTSRSFGTASVPQRRELTAADVVYTFRSLIDPTFRADGRLSSGAVVTRRSLHRRLPVEDAVRVVSDQPGDGDRAGGLGRANARTPIGTGPYRLVDVRCRRSHRRSRRSTATSGTAAQRRPRPQGGPGRHDARARAAQGHRRSRRQRPRPRHRLAAAREGRMQRRDRARHRLRLHRAEPAAIRSCATSRCARRLATRSIARRSSNTCAGGLPRRRSASCRRCRGRSSRTSSTSARSGAGGAAARRRGLSGSRTATVRCHASGCR